MKRWGIHGLCGLPWLAGCVLALLCVPAVSRGSPAAAEGEHPCVVLDAEEWMRDRPREQSCAVRARSRRS